LASLPDLFVRKEERLALELDGVRWLIDEDDVDHRDAVDSDGGVDPYGCALLKS
jgi:hypothetical protein